MKTKLVFNPKLARKLLQKGYKIVDIKPFKENIDKTIFIFEESDDLLKELYNN